MRTPPDEERGQATADALLHVVGLRGLVSPDDLAEPLGATREEVEAAVRALQGAGLLERRGDLVQLSAPGRARLAEARMRESLALREPVGLVYDRFATLNRTVKALLHRWQVRTDRTVDVPNDHSDAEWDAAVLADLERVQRAAAALLAPLEALRPRYAALRRRLAAALARAAAGDRRAVASVATDSFHAAWWELHADLLAMLDRPRGPDDA